MHFDITRSWDRPRSFRVESVASQFTLEDVNLSKRFTGELPIESEDWSIGVIVGRSGTGKSTIARELFPESYVKDLKYTHESILDDFPEGMGTAEVTRALGSVGFSSPPDWLKSYDQLSQGEKMRVDIARALLLPQATVVFDEFTSVVDREIAKISSYAVQKAVRRTDKKFIAVTCHYDIIDYLEPDWVLCTDDMSFTKKKGGTPPSRSTYGPAALVYGTTLSTTTI